MDENGLQSVLTHHRKRDEAFQLKMMVFLKNRRLSVRTRMLNSRRPLEKRTIK